MKRTPKAAWTIALSAFAGAIALDLGAAILSGVWVNAHEPDDIAQTSCASPECSAAGVARTMTRGTPDNIVRESGNYTPFVVWAIPDETFAIVTWGSSSCPLKATDLTAEGNNHVIVTFEPSPNEQCTADLAATTYEFALPDHITARPIGIEIDYTNSNESQPFTLY